MNTLEQYFTYQPVRTDKRKYTHEAINEAALFFAKVIECEVEDEETKKMAFYAIQQARMFANQGATIDELISDDISS
jgi:hypothetical protein